MAIQGHEMQIHLYNMGAIGTVPSMDCCSSIYNEVFVLK